jgi:isocitrate dehydrogenase kinase/phosphatase
MRSNNFIIAEVEKDGKNLFYRNFLRSFARWDEKFFLSCTVQTELIRAERSEGMDTSLKTRLLTF